ncbi:hypothetical protein SDC9_159439 [bioreactor metagenome]|uniref:Uncharacterized protein n=1 Tax=bioreactor metagenome TaxID=1076179 RepID=A0A645FCV5_9ZZZZ
MSLRGEVRVDFLYRRVLVAVLHIVEQKKPLQGRFDSFRLHLLGQFFEISHNEPSIRKDMNIRIILKRMYHDTHVLSRKRYK